MVIWGTNGPRGARRRAGKGLGAAAFIPSTHSALSVRFASSRFLPNRHNRYRPTPGRNRGRDSFDVPGDDEVALVAARDGERAVGRDGHVEEAADLPVVAPHES